MSVITPKLSLTDEIDVPKNINVGLICPNAAYLTALLGSPRDDYSDTCQNVSNKKLATLIKTESVGPFAVTGLSSAVESLKSIASEIKRSQPDVYSKLGTAGMLCCRYQRGSRKISSHSWGTAIDLKLAGKLDVRGNMKVHYGLSLISPIFNSHGWYWGAAFRTEDAMHFEVSKGKLEEWKSSGLFGSEEDPTLKRGDAGEAVRQLQRKLNQYGSKLRDDGDFGGNTEKALQKFQLQHNLRAEYGTVGEKTRKALKLS